MALTEIATRKNSGGRLLLDRAASDYVFLEARRLRTNSSMDACTAFATARSFLYGGGGDGGGGNLVFTIGTDRMRRGWISGKSSYDFSGAITLYIIHPIVGTKMIIKTHIVFSLFWHLTHLMSVEMVKTRFKMSKIP